MTTKLKDKHFVDQAHVVHMEDPDSVARIAAIAVSQIEQMLLLYPCEGIHIGWTYFAEGLKGRPAQHHKTKGRKHKHWMILFRVRGRHQRGRNHSPEALVRAAVLAQLGRRTSPSGKHDGLFSESTAHSDIWEMASSDVQAPLVQKAIRNFESHDPQARDELGYDSQWFWFFLTRNHADIIVYAGV
jgi:hypothetical protein